MNASTALSPKRASAGAWPRQAFRLSKEIVDSVSKEEVKATIEDMKKLNLAQAPFDQMDILVQEREIFSLYRKSTSSITQFEATKKRLDESTKEVIFRYDNTKKQEDKIVSAFLDGGHGDWFDLVDFVAESEGEQRRKEMTISVYSVGLDLLDILIVLLATKNVVKEVKECKLMKLGIGSKQRHRYTTSLRIGVITERSEGAGASEGEGAARRPHLRRGHIRRQHHGPKNELIKSIWIEPVFVNADPEWIADRTAYNVSMGAKA